MKHKKQYKKKTQRRGQSEIIGGLIVLTLLFAFAVPLMINTYYSTIKTNSQAQQAFQQLKTQYNEKILIQTLDPNNEAYIRAGWIPGVYINNTGTTQVTLTKLYLVNTYDNQIYTILDLRYARPDPITPLIKKMLINVTLPGTGQPPPPIGTPITLMPGESLLIVFNESILPVAPHLIVLVESARGVIHPIIGQGGAQPLYPGRPGEGGVGKEGAWRGIFAPQSGFLLIGADQIENFATIWGERPCYGVQGYVYYTGWAYDNDPDYPPFYRIEIDRYNLILRGFLGTFDISSSNSNYVYLDGWYITDGYYQPCYYRYTSDGEYEILNDNEYLLDNGNYLQYFMTTGDMDRNGVNEVIFYTYWIHYYGGSDRNPDSDFDRDSWSDSIAMYVQASRDISGVDYIKISAKIIYDLAISGDGEPNIPLKVYSLAVWEYDNGKWRLYSTKDFDFVNNGPKTFVVSGTFPVNRSKTYRVGVIFYDPIKETYSGAEYEFMMGLEHLIVEYGVLNPIFHESPPLYIVAINNETVISGLGEEDFALAYNLTDINEAKLKAQEVFLSKLREELNYAGIAGYTVITNASELQDLLFSENPPKYAIIIWLQGGNVSIHDVLPSVDTDEVINRINTYHWVLVWPSETPMAGELSTYNTYLSASAPGMYTANITDKGIEVRTKVYAFYLFNSLTFKYQIKADPFFESRIVIPDGVFYVNQTETGETYYGTAAFWVNGTGTAAGGAIVVNPVHIDWNVDGDGVTIDTAIQQTVYASLETWYYIRLNS